MKHRLFIAAILILLLSVPYSVTGKALTSNNVKSYKKFTVYQAWFYKKTPDLKKYGFHKLRVFYEASLTSADKASSKVRQFDASKIDKASALARHKQDNLVVLDIESWGHGQQAIKKYANAVRRFKRNDPAALVGMYDYYPYHSFLIYQYFTSGNPLKYFYWKNLQKEVTPVAREADVFLPSLYTWGTNIKAWEKTARIAVQKARELDPNKPIYAFIWPQYYGNAQHPDRNKDKFALDFISGKNWKAELETLYPICDGVIIWSWNISSDGKVIYFNKDMPWFKATVKFMDEHGIR